jgi:hypothetical protein
MRTGLPICDVLPPRIQPDNPRSFLPNGLSHPAKWLRKAEIAMVDRLKVAFEDLNALDRN